MKKLIELKLFALFLLILALLLLRGLETRSQGNLPHYRLIFSTYGWQDSNELPLTILRPMCWNDTVGWCDAGMEELGRRVAYLEDFQTGWHGLVMQNDSLCWLWWLEPEYGEDNNPHIKEGYIIECLE